jgi:hypothetical protein
MNYLEDDKLSNKAVGLLSRALHKMIEEPDFTVNTITMAIPVEGSVSIQQALKEIVSRGYGFHVSMIPDGERYEENIYSVFKDNESCQEALIAFGSTFVVDANYEQLQEAKKAM